MKSSLSKAYKKLEPDWWLELDKTYSSRIKQRQDLYTAHGSEMLQSLPGSEIACKELMEMCLQFLCSRYPAHFSIDARNLLFHNNILNTTTNLKEMDPLEVLLNNVPEDFAIVLRNPETGYYSFRAGVVCSSLGWSVASKIGMDLKDIHKPIPDYKEKMEFSMDRYVPSLSSPFPFCRCFSTLHASQKASTDMSRHALQILRQTPHRQTHPTRFLGFGNRRTPLHATLPPPLTPPQHTRPFSPSLPHKPARRLANPAPSPPLRRRGVQFQMPIHTGDLLCRGSVYTQFAVESDQRREEGIDGV